ncbi:MAG: epoxyqueuosine reductase QueH [Firmicutes bacterium]|nr:epoxyqueuosine reductase QueH [Bacillota bacterium]
MDLEDILLHTCCGPCATYTTEHMVAAGYAPLMYYYNPNIHPYREWQKRKETLEDFAEKKGLPLLLEEEYDLSGFLRMVVGKENERCPLCYAMRLERTAIKARELGYKWFGTTLLISPYQQIEGICRTGEDLARKYGLNFYGEDLRPGYRRSREISRELGLYRQPYCGCIFSERDRYYKPPKSG